MKNYSLSFTVASALLRELGERLVGQPHIALAELIKNSYDADSSKVEICVDPDANRIEIVDNGHGMDPDEFKRFWMSIGSPHKAEQMVSRNLGRPITGSKGVGRLSVQFLARKIELITVSEHDTEHELYAFVDWDEAVEAGLLTQATAAIKERRRRTDFPGEKSHGTKIVLTDLNQDWDSEDFKALARQVWWLQPPFAERLPKDDPRRFEIELSASDSELEEAFNTVANAVLNLWHARLRGKLVNDKDGCRIDLILDFNGGKRSRVQYPVDSGLLHKLKFDIRVFHLAHRQPHGIQVGEAREYLNKFGGVGIYDAGFRLPYYGPEQDWLGIEFDHSHRLHRSELLPEALQTSRGLQFLPTNSRLFGVVEVNTAQERSYIAENDRRKNRHLQIQISRDRLLHNAAYKVLRNAVRWALDYYATRESVRSEETKPAKPDEPSSQKLRSIEEVLEDYKQEIPSPVYFDLSSRIREAVKVSETEAERTLAHMELMGSLATAGMVALASEHEINQQYRLLERLISQLKQSSKAHRDLNPFVEDIESWLDRAKASRALFAPLLEREGREDRKSYRARSLLADISRRVATLSRGIPIDISSIDENLRFPAATLATWHAIFQNVLLNAVNALIDSRQRNILVSSGSTRGKTCIWVQDTGAGVDLSEADSLFKPFERRLEITPERKRLGIGGTGLGLTIVRLLADQAGCEVGFVPPEQGYSTKFQLSWKE